MYYDVAGRNRVFLDSWSRSRSHLKNQEPEPLGKKSGAGVAWKKSQEPKPEPMKKFAGSPALILRD